MSFEEKHVIVSIKILKFVENKNLFTMISL